MRVGQCVRVRRRQCVAGVAEGRVIRAAITGWAWRTPLGAGDDDVISRLLAGERAVRANPRFDATTYPCTVATTILGDPKARKHRRFLKRMGLHGIDVA